MGCKDEYCSYLKMVRVLAKLRIGPLTTSMPRSSDALSWWSKMHNNFHYKKTNKHLKGLQQAYLAFIC